MRSGGAKKKGNKFENSIYKKLQKEGFNVRKSLGSGNAHEAGDLIITTSEGEIYLELKHHKILRYAELMGFHKKLCKEAQQETYCFVIYKENNRDVVVGLRENIWWRSLPFDLWLGLMKESILEKEVKE